MPRLNRITTRGGDAGMTSLGDGSRVSKTHPLPALCGWLDEANVRVGMALVTAPAVAVPMLRRVQNELFDVGADVCRPYVQNDGALRVTSDYVLRLEADVAALNAELPPLTSFVIPGGAAAWLHLARTGVRTAERAAVAAAEVGPLNGQVIVYLNRLSDLLFVAARHVQPEALWQPGGDLL